MIEDFENENIPNSYKNNSQPNKAGMLLFVFIIWVIFATILVLIAKPKIDTALKETNAVEIIKNRKKLANQINTTETTLYFAQMRAFSEYRIVGYQTEINATGDSPLHNALEGLLSGATDTALQNGSISFIPKGTKLIGASVSNGIAFVDLSEQFLTGQYSIVFDYIPIAEQQILKTIQATDSDICELVLLVEGKEINQLSH